VAEPVEGSDVVESTPTRQRARLKSSVESEAKFRHAVAEAGWTVTGDYINRHTVTGLLCPQGHDASKTPGSFLSGVRCGVCSGKNSGAARGKFEAAVKAEGWTQRSEYVRALDVVQLVCPVGHRSDKTPHEFMDGNRCGICSRTDNRDAERRFLAAVSDAGWTFSGTYKSARSKAELRCPEGHRADKTPGAFLAGHRCAVCDGQSSDEAAARFREAAADAGWSVLGEYVNSATSVPMLCDKGHRSDKPPRDYMSGYRCAVCARTDQATAILRFMAALNAEGWVLIGDYVASNTVTAMQCPNGHRADKSPGSFLSGVRCAVCSQKDFGAAKVNFEQAVSIAGWTLLSPYAGARAFCELSCPEGHRVRKAPGSFMGGTRCAVCAGKNYDRVYLIRHPALPYVKVGIASNGRRIAKHQACGWTLLWQTSGMDSHNARTVERSTLKVVREWGFPPLSPEDVPGRDGFSESFSIDALQIALDVISAHGFDVPLAEVLLSPELEPSV
jgi:hypothetical protein